MCINKNSAMAESEAVSFGTAYDHFAESAELCGLIDALPHICHEQIAMEASQERVTGRSFRCSVALDLSARSMPRAVRSDRE